MTFATRIHQTIRISSVLLFLVIAARQTVSAQLATSASPLLIYQVQTGSPSSASQEYIAIYNNTDQPVDVTNWCVTYASASDVSQSQLVCFKPPETTIKLFVKPHGSLLLVTSEFLQAQPGFTADETFTAGLAATSGHIKLLDPSKKVQDLVGWGLATKPEGLPVAAPAAGKILQRISILQNQNQLQDTNDNTKDFLQTERALPSGGNLYEEKLQIVSGANPLLSEILPDSIGADTGKEFIELHNPSNETINLADYSLQIGPAYTKIFTLPDKLLEPDGYVVFSDTQTGITLPNTTGSVRLVDPNGITINETNYDNVEEGASFIYIDGVLHVTYRPTPGLKNILLATKPCPEEQVRSEETGQCKSAAPATSVLPCKVGQVRNIETGRCRNTVAVSSVAATCKAGQNKNPATGRCRNVAAVPATKPCPAGQERNPDSGRCKKVSAIVASGTNSVKDVPSAVVSSKSKLLIAIGIALAAIGYAAYEWRHEVVLFTQNVKRKLVPGKKLEHLDEGRL